MFLASASSPMLRCGPCTCAQVFRGQFNNAACIYKAWDVCKAEKPVDELHASVAGCQSLLAVQVRVLSHERAYGIRGISSMYETVLALLACTSMNLSAHRVLAQQCPLVANQLALLPSMSSICIAFAEKQGNGPTLLLHTSTGMSGNHAIPNTLSSNIETQ